MSLLAQQLDSLRLEDGSRDMQARKSELHKLISSVSSSERRFLRDHLHEISFNFDIISNLPIEILVFVSAYLDLEDFMRCRSVCRQWRGAFSNPDFCDSIAKRHFRPIWESTHGDTDPEEVKDKKQTLADSLPRLATKRIRRSRLQYSSMSAYSYTDSTEVAYSQQYCNGRIAYTVDQETILVKDLRTGLAIVIVEENRETLGYWQLSDQFIIAWMWSPWRLLAWRVDVPSDDPPFMIRLPSHPKQLTAYHDQVGFITDSSEAMIWKIGGELKSLDTSKIDDNLISEFSFRNHSLKFDTKTQDRIFVVSTGMSKSLHSGSKWAINIIIVQDYYRGTPGNYYHLDNIDWFGDNRWFPLDTINIEDGAIGFVQRGTVCISKASCSHEISCKDQFQPPRTHSVIKFDTDSREFSLSCYHYPSGLYLGMVGMRGSTCPFYWRGQTTFTVADELWSRTRLPKWPADVPYTYGITASSCIDSSYSPVDRPFRQLKKQDYETAAAVLGAPWAYDTQRVVRGDDDYFIIFGKQGYVVWCFDENVQLPPSQVQIAPSGSDASLYPPHD